MEIIGFIVAYLALLHAIDSYVKSHLEKDDREFRLSLALFLKKNYFHLGYTKLLKKILNFSEKLYGDILSLNSIGTSIVIAIIYSTLTILLMWLFSGNNSIASIQILPSISLFIDRFVYFLLTIFLFIFIYIVMAFSVTFDMAVKEMPFSDFYKNKLDLTIKLLIKIYINISSFFSVIIFCISVISPFVLFSVSPETLYRVLVIIIAISFASITHSWRNGGVILTLPFTGFMVGMFSSIFVDISWIEGAILGAGASSLMWIVKGTSSNPGGSRMVILILIFLLASFVILAFLESNYISPYTEIQSIKNIIKTYVYPNTNQMATIQKSLPVIFFLVLIPIVNGLWDWISIGISRILAQEVFKTIQSSEKYIVVYIKFFLYALLDIVLAIIILIFLIATLTILISLVNTVIHFYDLSNIININSIWDNILNKPTSADSIWIIFLLVSTLIPTFLHILVMAISLFSFDFKNKFQSEKLIQGLRNKKVDSSTVRKTSFYLSIVLPVSVLLSVGFLYVLFQITTYSFEKTSVNLTEYSKEVYIKSNSFFEKKISKMEFFSKPLLLEIIEEAKKNIESQNYQKALNGLNNFLEDYNQADIKKSYLSKIYILKGEANIGLSSYENAYLYFDLAFTTLKAYSDDRFYFDFLFSSSDGKEVDIQKLKLFYHMLYKLIFLFSKTNNSDSLLSYLIYVNKVSNKYLEDETKYKPYIYFNLSNVNYLLNNTSELNKYISLLLDEISISTVEKNFNENHFKFIRKALVLTFRVRLKDDAVRKRYDILTQLSTMNLNYAWIYNALAWTPVEYSIARSWITWEKAELHAKKALELFPNSPDILGTIAAIYCFQEKYDLAIKANEKMIQENNNKYYMRYYNVVDGCVKKEINPYNIEDWNNLK